MAASHKALYYKSTTVCNILSARALCRNKNTLFTCYPPSTTQQLIDRPKMSPTTCLVIHLYINTRKTVPTTHLGGATRVALLVIFITILSDNGPKFILFVHCYT